MKKFVVSLLGIQYEIIADSMSYRDGSVYFMGRNSQMIAIFSDYDYAYEEGTKIKIIQTKKTDDSYDGEIDFVYEKPYDEMADYGHE